ncbi:hypothetical protein ZIOFF_070196 [Zingiber officinale]|uniref:Anamorsin homolog n=2 Tax=Zingiber officinale TaxID=94328 RepID=A0A8J5CEP8_ZINOF|nr:hypothetical protein ZIOFF_070196 [Zingiber officinale]
MLLQCAMAGKSSALLLTDDAALDLAVVLSAIRDIGVEAISEDEVAVITQCETLEGKLSNESSSFDVVVLASKKYQLIGEQWLQEIGRVLKPGGTLLLQAIAVFDISEKTSSTLERKLLMQGFVEVQPLEMNHLLSVGDSRYISIKAKKASWTTGSSFPLKKAMNTSVPKIIVNNESDLIDEDSLLTDEDLKKPQLPIIGDCEVGSTRKACKNCTCGRADSEAKVQKLELTAEQISNPQSACGNCGLGDAFRCSGCPYKGLSPFKLGEKVSLSGNFLAADI